MGISPLWKVQKVISRTEGDVSFIFSISQG